MLVLGVCCYLAFFHRMSTVPLEVFDEGRLAVNAAEMLTSRDWLVTRYGEAPDLWNTKPPLLIWMQAALLATGLPREAAVRTPSAVAATLTVLGLLLFCHRYLRSTAAGLVAGLVLVTSRGFTGYHVGRSADYDALLTAWVCLYALAYFIYLESDDQRRQTAALTTFFVAVIGAVFTKSVAGLIGAVALLPYTLVTGQLRRVLSDWRIYAGAAAAAAVATFVLVRERAAPGYWAAVLANDVSGRYGTVIEEHVGGPAYYIFNFSEGRFVPWVFLLPLVPFAVNLPPRDRSSRLTLFLITLAAGVLLVLSTAGTKIEWYDAQLYPPMALMLGLGFARAMQGAPTLRGDSLAARIAGLMRPGLAGAAVAVLFALPLANNLLYFHRYRSWRKPMVSPQRDYGQFFDHLQVGRRWRDLQVVDRGLPNTAGLIEYNATLQFHRVLENAEGASIRVVSLDSLDSLDQSRPVVTCDSVLTRRLAAERRIRWVERWQHCAAGMAPAEIRPFRDSLGAALASGGAADDQSQGAPLAPRVASP